MIAEFNINKDEKKAYLTLKSDDGTEIKFEDCSKEELEAFLNTLFGFSELVYNKYIELYPDEENNSEDLETNS
jgi:hypothetical protein